MSNAILQMFEGHKAFGAQSLFVGASFSLNEGEHVGVIGPNGAGKTTLFKVLVEEEELDSGRLIRSKTLRIGYLSQHDEWPEDLTGEAYLQANAQIPLWELKSQARALQISEAILAKPIRSLSGGYRMRIKLMGLLGHDPNLMLLDEPTNYLDLETTLLVERFLQSYRGAFLLISHDREFLRRTTDHTLEVEAGEITKYNGNIDDYFEQKTLLRQQQEAAAQNQAERRRHLLEFIERFGAKATKARQAQSKMKALEKMESIEVRSVPVTAKIKIPAPSHVGKTVLKIRDGVFAYGGGRPVLQSVNVEIRRGDHVAVVGLNGAGKSTLLKGLAGTLTPVSGARELGLGVEMAIFNQHVVEVLKPGSTISESLAEGAHPSVTPQDVRGMAGALLFSDDVVNKRVEVLSGGEKSRVALGQVLLRRAPLLLLDEPTNHLDFQTVEALTQALKDYLGTLVVVSHDRGFVSRVASRILEVSSGEVHGYPGTYDEYVWHMQQQFKGEEGEETARSSAGEPPPSKESPGALKKEMDRKRRQAERRLQQIETKIQELQAEVESCNVAIAEGRGDAREHVEKMSLASQQIQELESEWLELSSHL
ncbi:MAG: ABC-F family ATP-binding cassette domain-containing protein [Bdellovibrionales bacterium]